MGIGADASNKAFPSSDVTAFLARAPVEIHTRLGFDPPLQFVLAADPAGGGSSAFSVFSMCQLASGMHVVRRRLPGPVAQTLP